jgi:hypothetical protein
MRFVLVARPCSISVGKILPFNEQKACQIGKWFEYSRLGLSSYPRPETSPPSGAGIGNSHHMLQVRYCAAALIIDERMQI